MDPTEGVLAAVGRVEHKVEALVASDMLAVEVAFVATEVAAVQDTQAIDSAFAEAVSPGKLLDRVEEAVGIHLEQLPVGYSCLEAALLVPHLDTRGVPAWGW